MRLSAGLLVLLTGLVGLAAPASAQGDIVTPSEAQIALYSEGAQAFQAEDYPKAIRLFKASLDLGELNITHLNLGRAYFKGGDCARAAEHYTLAESAPKLAEPTPAQVQSKIDEYRGDLAQCAGTLLVTCTPGTVQVEIDGDSPMACDGKPISLKPGKHAVVGVLEGKTELKRVEIIAMQETTLALKIDVAAPVVDPNPKASGSDSLALAGWITLGTGGAIILGAVLYDTLVLVPDLNTYDELNARKMLNPMELTDRSTLKSDLESGQVLVRAMLGIGIASAATGLVLVLLSGPDETPAASPATSGLPFQFGAWADGQQAGVGMSGVW